jgi:hypothetical protein
LAKGAEHARVRNAENPRLQFSPRLCEYTELPLGRRD